MVDTARLSGERLAGFERDREESNRRYDHAFNVVLSHTSAVELEEFWRLFATSSIMLDPHDADTAFHSNPMAKGWSKSVVGGEGADLGDVFANPTSTFEGENPLALAGETNEPMAKSVASGDEQRRML